MKWSYPIREVNQYIERLVQAGFEDRVMFGTDQPQWPGLMPTQLASLKKSEYLTLEQKHDILFNNAVPFYRLDPKSFKTQTDSQQ
jgi:predicted TIM-barrel fold metal-dependent hydrolase